MHLDLTPRQSIALRKRAGTFIRSNKINPEDFQPHSLSWRALGDLSAETKRQAKALLEGFKEEMPPEELRDLEAAHEAILAIFDAIEHEKDIRSATGSREARSDEGDPRRPIPRDAVARGQALCEDLEYAEAAEANVMLRSDQSYAQFLAESRGTPVREYRGLTIGSYFRAMVAGPRSEAEKRALAEGTDSAGGYTVPDILSAQMIDRMRAASTVIRAGARTLPLKSDVNYIAKVLTDPVPAWRAENDIIAESEPTFGRVTLTPRSLAVMFKVSRELLEDSINIGETLPMIIAEAMAGELDRVALLGTGTPPQPKGVANFSGLTSNAFSGGAIVGYQQLMLARKALMGANAMPTAYVMSTRDENTIVGTLDGEGRPVMPPPVIANIPMLATTRIPVNGGVGTNESKIFAGDWSRLLIGIRHELRVEILKERYADYHQYAFIAVMRADVAATHEAAFTVLNGITA